MLDRHESAHSHTHRKILAIEKLCSRLSLRAWCQHKHRIIHTLNDHCICIFSLSLWLYQAILGCLVTGATGELNERGKWGERVRRRDELVLVRWKKNALCWCGKRVRKTFPIHSVAANMKLIQKRDRDVRILAALAPPSPSPAVAGAAQRRH